MYWISKNENITLDFIKNINIDKWDWTHISSSPNITIGDIENNPYYPWVWYFISKNTFLKEKNEFYLKHYKRYFATFRLQQYFNRMYDNPRYAFCRKRLYKLFT